MTNAEKLAKDTRTLAHIMSKNETCTDCPAFEFCVSNRYKDCRLAIKDWLESEAEEHG